LLARVKSYIRRFVSLTDAQANVMAVWVLHTYAVAAAAATPYLSVNSAERRSGKTGLFEVLAVAVFWRKVDAESPTLLLDESDAAFNGQRDYAEALQGVLDTGHRRGGSYWCCETTGREISYKRFSTFCAKAIAGIGQLPGTLEDRAINIRLKRALRTERMERFRRRSVEAEAANPRVEIAAWCREKLPLS
jgi:hypothetical protein